MNQIIHETKEFVRKALKKSWAYYANSKWVSKGSAINQSSETSFIIYNIFGGEILKTHMDNGWYFYNRIDGECIDFTNSETSKSSEYKHLEDLPSTPDETHNYFTQEDYFTLYTRFIKAYEEAIGLKN